MNLKFVSFFSAVVCILIILAGSYNNPAETHVAGSPAARCGSIADPLTCSNCHSGGPNTIQPGWITSNIPATGYVPGMTYTITATATSVGRVRFGFEISPQDSSTVSTGRGTCLVTDSTTQLLTGSYGRKYITHKSNGTTGTTDSHTWTFDWTAPTTGIDSVIFYGAFLCANNMNNSSGDFTYKSRLTVHRDITAGLEENFTDASGIQVYPQPATDGITVKYRIDHQEKVNIKLADCQGRIIAPLMSETRVPGSYDSVLKFPFNLSSGIYLLEISTETTATAKKILVQH